MAGHEQSGHNMDIGSLMQQDPEATLTGVSLNICWKFYLITQTRKTIASIVHNPLKALEIRGNTQQHCEF